MLWLRRIATWRAFDGPVGQVVLVDLMASRKLDGCGHAVVDHQIVRGILRRVVHSSVYGKRDVWRGRRRWCRWCGRRWQRRWQWWRRHQQFLQRQLWDAIDGESADAHCDCQLRTKPSGDHHVHQVVRMRIVVAFDTDLARAVGVLLDVNLRACHASWKIAHQSASQRVDVDRR